MQFDCGYTMLIGGVATAASETIDVFNPATAQVIAQAPDISRDQLDQAIAAASAAFPFWKSTPIAERQTALKAIAARIEIHVDELAALFTREHGRPLADAKTEILSCIGVLRHIAGQALPVEVHLDTPARRIETRHVPIGVVAAIAPWNFPLILAFGKVASALLTGNSVVLKPSPFTPLTTLKIGELIGDLLPPGVLNIVSGGDRLGPWITEHPGIDKIAFTGSTQTGKAIMRSASTSLKRVTLELGGNDPAIVLADVDVDALAPTLFWMAFRNNAQFCVATKRMYIHESIYDRMAAAIVAYARTVKVGDGADPDTRIGPVQNRPQYERVRALIDDAKASGIHFLIGGDVAEGPGYFIPVTIADNPPDDARVVVEEAFGPVLPLLKFASDDEVIRRANDSIYGLGSSIWSSDLVRAQSIADRLEAGRVWINTPQEIGPYPFGGHKQSGLGVENGSAGLLEYTNSQTVMIGREVR
jgi:acyl-CoA reductase-like NAD-dependent aldehyde dehydrogenase